MALKQTVNEMNELLAAITQDLQKAEGGNKAAAQRVRTGTIQMEKVAKKYRKESIAEEKSGKGSVKKSAAKKPEAKKVAVSRSESKKPVAKVVKAAKPAAKQVALKPGVKKVARAACSSKGRGCSGSCS